MQLNTDMRFEIVADSLEKIESETKVIDGVEVTSQGYWLVECRAARDGSQTYMDVRYPEGKRIEARHIEDIEDPDSLASWMHAPLFIHHSGWASTKNTRELKHGYVYDHLRSEEINGRHYLVFKACLDTEEIISGVRSGQLVELSPGYDRDFDGIAGVLDGVAYHGSQKNIRINHLAFLPPGMARGGHYARTLLDGGKECLYFDFNKKGEGTIMSQQENPTVTLQRVVLDSKNHVDLEPKLAEVVQDALSSKDTEIKTVSKQLSDSQDELKTANGKITALEAEKTELQGQVSKIVDSAEKQSTLDKAQSAGLLKTVTTETLDSLTNAELKKQAVAERFPERALDSEDPKAIDGMFSVIVEIPAPNTPKPPVGSGNPSAAGQQIFDAIGKGDTKTQDSNEDPTGKAAYQADLAKTTTEVLGG